MPGKMLMELNEIETKYQFFRMQHNRMKEEGSLFEFTSEYVPQIAEESKKLNDIYSKLAVDKDEIRALGTSFLRYGKRIEKYERDLVDFYQDADNDIVKPERAELDKDEEVIKNLEVSITKTYPIFEKIAFRSKVRRLMDKYRELLSYNES
jgi:hypothetical protein